MIRRSGRRGRLIAIEGIDGSGKSTLVRALLRALRRAGWTVASRREPADRALGALAQSTSVHDAWTGGVYFTVDRHLARKGLDRDLAAHDVVLTDRSLYSTLAYQGSALPAKDRRRLAQLQRASTVVPDRMVLLDLDPDEAIRRLGKRALARGPLERLRVLRRVAAEYRTLSRGPGWIVVDARLPTAVEVRLVLERLRPLLPPPRPRPRSRGARRRR